MAVNGLFTIKGLHVSGNDTFPIDKICHQLPASHRFIAGFNNVRAVAVIFIEIIRYQWPSGREIFILYITL